MTIPTIMTLEESVYHGYVQSPRSRAVNAHENGRELGIVGTITPQSIEAPKGFPAYERISHGQVFNCPPDGELASAGLEPFKQLDGATAPNGTPWPAMRVTAGGVIRLRWWLTAAHKTTKWHYYCTKPGWKPYDGLSRATVELFAVFHWHQNPDRSWEAPMPLQDIQQWLFLPEREGRHVIFCAWDIADTDMAFYQAVDVEFHAR